MPSTSPTTVMETEPLLGGSPSTTPRHRLPAFRWVRPLRDHVTRWSTLYLCGLMIFLVDFPSFMGEAAKVRMLESALCRDHYREVDTSLIGTGGEVPEDLCKIPPVQSELARMRGFLGMLDSLPGLFLAIPFGLLADAVGRKFVLFLGLTGGLLNYLYLFVVLYFHDVFPTKAVYGAAAFQLIGGGSIVITATLLAVIAHASTEEIRTPALFYINVTALSSEVLSPIVGSVLMRTIGSHFTFLLGTVLASSCLIPLYFMRDDPPKPAGTESDDERDGPAPRNSFRDSVMKMVRFIRDDIRPLLVQSSVLVGLVCLALYRVGRPLLELVLQYMSVRFGWPLSTTNLLISVQGAVQIFLFLLVLPQAYKWFLRRANDDGLVANIGLAKVCLGFLALGCLGMALAPADWIFIISMIFYVLGTGYGTAMRSLLTSLVDPSHVSLLYTTMAVFESLVQLGAPALLGLSLSWGINKGGLAVSLPFFITVGLYCVAIIGVWSLNVSRPREAERADDGEEEEREPLMA